MSDVKYISIENIKNHILDQLKIKLDVGDRFKDRWGRIYEFDGWTDSWLTYDPNSFQPYHIKGSWYIFNVTLTTESKAAIGMSLNNVKKIIREGERL
jgi:hypothetical protein